MRCMVKFMPSFRLAITLSWCSMLIWNHKEHDLSLKKEGTFFFHDPSFFFVLPDEFWAQIRDCWLKTSLHTWHRMCRCWVSVPSRKDFLQKFCNFVFGARLHHRQLRNITFSSNFGTATRQNSFLNWKGTTVDESVSQGSVQNHRKHFKLLTYQKQKTLISRYCRSLRRTRANLGICFWVGKIIPNAWEPNTFWEFDSQYATVGEHLCRGYCLFFHCHCRPQPTFELTSLHRVSFQPAIMWWKDCRALHKTFVLMKNIVSHFFHLLKLEVFDRENNFDADPCFSSNTSRKFLFDC